MTVKWKPGQSGNPKGRPAGVPNKLTRTVKQVFEETFVELQKPLANGDPNPASLPEFAKRSPKEFYQLAKVLIPTKIEGDLGGLIVNLTTGVPKPSDEDTDASDIA